MTPAHERRIGLTGSTGVLGAALRRHAHGVQWLPFDGDIRDARSVQRWVNQRGPFDAVIHCAAIVPTGLVDEQPDEAFRVNVGGTVHLLEAIRASRHAVRPWVCVISTSHVYGPSEAPLSEEAPLTPVSLYGMTKLQSEQWALAYMEKYGLDVCVPRLFSYTDPCQASSYLVPSMIVRLSDAPPNGRLAVRGADDVRDFLGTEDVVSALTLLQERRARGVYNVGSGSGICVFDLVNRLRELLGRTDVTLERAAATGRTCLVADTTRLRQLGWAPAVQCPELLAAMVAGARARTS